ncbi:DUF2167 domain-containing protein [Aquimarina sp. BL5]|uniref:DUF2167 domain-containing protein n=1 Tax=Aquimarina sp. BL5 TaxID=1714860 RepID=UPI000E4EB0EE|nr:DUF2167 domain-containing protein [Aquimarina sp. BL5]AXT49387.1 DUF2167 domain-containing protein [Aquimarina sp. BL5]RKN07964.1 DUF2167 domain-containing protein [Aquimarina sp. BL5]
MNKITLKTLILALLLLSNLNLWSQEEASNEETVNMDELLLQFQKYKDSIDKTFNYQTGDVMLGDNLALLNVPEGYRFLDKEQANYVLTDLWGNPSNGDYGLLGMLVKQDESPVDVSYAVEVSYSEEGYIEDDDAEDIDYDELLVGMQDDAKNSNPERVKQGYPTINLVGWASAPFYDQQNKKLHWAQEYKFGEDDENTLNYNIRVLGRKGYINLNVIGDMEVLDDVKNNLDPILASVEFKEGNRYADFNPDLDEVAAYGIGGLIAGKVLAKAGFFALILKFWKFIALGIGGVFMAFKNKLFGKKEA